MQFLDLTLPTLHENLALDEALLLAAEAGAAETLRIWHWPTYAVVLGAGGRLADDVHEDACQTDRVPIARRSSGGGTVLLGPGCFLYSVIVCFDRDPVLRDLHGSYRNVLGRIQRGLEPFVGPLVLNGSSDLTWHNKKLSGNAQQRKRTHLLHHGSLLHAMDLSAVQRFLKKPPRQPEYRQQREHGDFLVNLPISSGVLNQITRDAWQAYEIAETWPSNLVGTLVAEKYGLEEWVRRR